MSPEDQEATVVACGDIQMMEAVGRKEQRGHGQGFHLGRPWIEFMFCCLADGGLCAFSSRIPAMTRTPECLSSHGPDAAAM